MLCCRSLFKKRLKPDSNGINGINAVSVRAGSDVVQSPEKRLGLQLLGTLGNKLGKVKVNGGSVGMRDGRKMSDDGLQLVRRQDISVPSTTALILQDRPM